MLPKEIAKMVPKNRLMAENEWRALGVQQSQGWIHYMIHGPGREGSSGLGLQLIILPPCRTTHTSVQETDYRSRSSKKSRLFVITEPLHSTFFPFVSKPRPLGRLVCLFVLILLPFPNPRAFFVYIACYVLIQQQTEFAKSKCFY